MAVEPWPRGGYHGRKLCLPQKWAAVGTAARMLRIHNRGTTLCLMLAYQMCRVGSCEVVEWRVIPLPQGEEGGGDSLDVLMRVIPLL